MTFHSTSKSNGTAKGPPDHQPERAGWSIRRRLVLYGLILTAILIWPAWQRLQFARHLSQAQRALSADDAPLAVARLLELDQRAPGRADVQYLLGVAYRRIGVIDAALFRLRRAERLGWSAEPIRRQRVLAEFQAGDIEVSRSSIDQLLSQQLSTDETTEVYEALVKGYLAAFRLVEARACLHHWLEWQPHALQPRLWMGQILEFQRDYLSAVETYKLVLVTAPDHQEARSRLAQALVRLNRLDEAIGLFEKLHEEQPGDTDILLGFARCLRVAGQDARAEVLLKQALLMKMPPNRRAFALVEAGQICLARKDIPTAIEQLSEAVRLDPNNQVGHHALGTALSRVGQKAYAEEHFNRSAQMLKRHEEIRELTKGLLRQPGDAALQYEVGITLLELGLKHEALRWLLLAAASHNPPPGTDASLAELYSDLGNQLLADKYRTRAQVQAVETTRDATESSAAASDDRS